MNMKVAKGPIVVQSYHYDLVDPDSEIRTNLQAQVQDYEDSEQQSEGKMIQIMTPFGIHPENAPFAISGLIGQVIQFPDWKPDEPLQLNAKQMQELSQPLVEQIQIITYQLTAMTLDHGYQLDFQPTTGDNSKTEGTS